MNSTQRKILYVAIAICAVMLVFPPVAVTDEGQMSPEGYRPIFLPAPDGFTVVNYWHLLLQWGIVVAFAYVAFSAKAD